MHRLPREIPTRLETERLIVRKYAEGDGQELFLLLERDGNREFLRENVEEAAAIRTEEEAEIWVRKRSAEWLARERFVMGLWLKSENQYVGQVWIEPKNWDVPSFEIGWFLDHCYQGRGIATEAVRCSLELPFGDFRAHKVIAVTRDTNVKGIRLVERLGFCREGHLRESGIQDGKRYGLLYYGMLRTEFPSKQC